jgi:hypothetical protein
MCVKVEHVPYISLYILSLVVSYQAKIQESGHFSMAVREPVSPLAPCLPSEAPLRRRASTPCAALCLHARPPVLQLRRSRVLPLRQPCAAEDRRLHVRPPESSNAALECCLHGSLGPLSPELSRAAARRRRHHSSLPWAAAIAGAAPAPHGVMSPSSGLLLPLAVRQRRRRSCPCTTPPRLLAVCCCRRRSCPCTAPPRSCCAL